MKQRILAKRTHSQGYFVTDNGYESRTEFYQKHSRDDHLFIRFATDEDIKKYATPSKTRH